MCCYITENKLATKQACCFPQLGGYEIIMDDATNNDRRIPIIIKIFDWCVCGAPSRLNMRSPTKSHSLQYLQFMVSHSLNASVNWTGVYIILATSEDFAHSRFHLDIFSATSGLLQSESGGW